MQENSKKQENFKCLVVTEKGLTGTLNQCLAVAERLKSTLTVLEISPRTILSYVQPFIRICVGKTFAPHPDTYDYDVIICAGRKAIAPALWIKQQCKKAGKHPELICLMDPKIPPRRFNLVCTARHDRLNGENVYKTLGVPTKFTTNDFASTATTPKTVAVLIGGSNRHQVFDETAQQNLVQSLSQLTSLGHRLLITLSRRTPSELGKLITTTLHQDSFTLWSPNMETPNPYIEFLAQAEHIVLTSDSVSMACDAAMTGKPIYRYDLPDKKTNNRVSLFHKQMQDAGIIRPLSFPLESWTYEFANPADLIAEKIEKQIALSS